jgi:hypothetical protein
MAKKGALARLLFMKARKLRPSKKTLVTTFAAVGAGGMIGGAASAPPGGRDQGGREGATAALALTAAGTIGSAIVFRKIRGRIIPIRVKKTS